MKKIFSREALWILIILLFVALTFIVYITFETWAVQVLSACLGAIITIIATRLLLSSQSKIDSQRREEEEKAKRDLELYNAKLKVYSDFVSEMYDTLRDNKIEEKEILDLRTKIFGSVSFYASGDILESINNELSAVDNYTDVQKMQQIFARIAYILQSDLRKQWDSDPQSACRLWNTFDGILDNSVSSKNEEESVTTENPIPLAAETNGVKNSINNTFWHFAMWSAEEQIGALRNGINELNLIEYEEEWRTNLIKQVKEDDLVFLFRSGGFGYMGVYRIIGWRVFQFLDDNKVIETIKTGNKTETITDETQILNDLKRSDIYHSREDGADYCSSLIVEPLAFAKNGIGNPGGVYRRTISRYDHGYGLSQLARFMAIMDDPNNYDVHFNGDTTVRMGCNKEKFVEILKEGDIKPAERDENGNWK